MTSSAANPMDAVAVLMKERQRIEEWISQLESRRSITPPHVFERVRGDYEARLQDVMQKLAGRTSEVQATAAALTTHPRCSSEPVSPTPTRTRTTATACTAPGTAVSRSTRSAATRSTV